MGGRAHRRRGGRGARASAPISLRETSCSASVTGKKEGKEGEKESTAEARNREREHRGRGKRERGEEKNPGSLNVMPCSH